MKCKCGKDVDVSDKRLIPQVLNGKRKIIIPCECGEQYKIRMKLAVDKFIEGVDEELEVEDGL